LGAGLGSATQEVTLDADTQLLCDAALSTGEILGNLLRRAALLPAEQVVRLGSGEESVPAGAGSMVDATAWVQPSGGSLTLPGVALPDDGAAIAPRVVLPAHGDSRARVRPIAEVPTAALIAGTEWLFDVAAGYVVERSANRERDDVERAGSVDERAREAE